MADRDRPRSRLDQPKAPRRVVPRPTYSPDAFGRFAEGFARFMGTARFLAYMTLLVVLWISINLVGLFGLRWDPYPFILLNLIFSTQASYAAPLILLAQNRQADRDRVAIEEDRQRTVAAKADTEYLAREIAALRIALGEVATRDFIRSEMSRLLEQDREAHAVEGVEGADGPTGDGGARPDDDREVRHERRGHLERHDRPEPGTHGRTSQARL